jgi:putative tryptophan/tyrosine transport system substrate-binding protein
MRRRDFITLVGSAASAWPLATRAQQGERMRRIGVLMVLAEDDPESSARIAAFRNTLNGLGWTEGKNLRMDIRWGIDESLVRSNATELVALAPDVILANATPAVLAAQQASRTVPIVFTATTDPVAMGIVQSLARPGGNATGFTAGEYGESAKWLELLKEIAPGVSRVAVLELPSNPGSVPQFVAIQTAAPSYGIELSQIHLGAADQIEHDVATFAGAPKGGMIVTRIAEAISRHDLITKLAAHYGLPTVYPLRLFVAGGGLVSYGPDIVETFRQAAAYVNRILKGEKPADLPVQNPTKYELVVDLKAAKALGLAIPQTVLARADEVIE